LPAFNCRAPIGRTAYRRRRPTPTEWDPMSTPRRVPARSVTARMAPDDATLAWELAAAARPHLGRFEADRIYIAIGIGETFAAIDTLITAIARDRIALGEDLLATTSTWLDCYLGQNAEPRLRQLVAEVARASSQPMPQPKERHHAQPVVSPDGLRPSG
jgi:hypothetical protein